MSTCLPFKLLLIKDTKCTPLPHKPYQNRVTVRKISIFKNFLFEISFFLDLDNCSKRLFVPERAFAIEKGVGDL